MAKILPVNDASTPENLTVLYANPTGTVQPEPLCILIKVFDIVFLKEKRFNLEKASAKLWLWLISNFKSLPYYLAKCRADTHS